MTPTPKSRFGFIPDEPWFGDCGSAVALANKINPGRPGFFSEWDREKFPISMDGREPDTGRMIPADFAQIGAQKTGISAFWDRRCV